MLWLNETYLMDPHTHNQIKSEVVTPQHIAKLVCYIGGVGLGSLLIVVSLVLSLVNYRFCNRREELVSYSLNRNGYGNDPYDVNK